MKIGIFDSGLGGLNILKSLRETLPQYDYIYLGDTKNLPYGSKSQSQIYKYSRAGVDKLFKKGCEVVLVACNTASTRALRKLQKDWLPKNYPERKILGPLIPGVEAAAGSRKTLVIATDAAVKSRAFIREFAKYNPKTKVLQISAPKVVPLIEAGKSRQASAEFIKILNPFLMQNIDTIILGSTHYALLKESIRSVTAPKIRIISHDEVVPKKFKDYLKRHKEVQKLLSRGYKVELYVTKSKAHYQVLVDQWFGRKARVKLL